MAEEGGTDSLADRIRAFVHRRYLVPAESAGRTVVEVRAGDVHREMSLDGRMPAVCSALGRKFEREYGVELVDRRGPPQGANVYFRFRHSAGSGEPRQKPKSVDQPSRNQATANRAGTNITTSPAIPARSDTVFLVSCVSEKRTTAVPAKDLYTSDWFTKARRYVEQAEATWYILSAEHGLISPDQVVSPYERTLNTMPVEARRRWAETVAAQFAVALPNARYVTFLAGARYREFLVGLLENSGIQVSVPMEGLRIGEQLSWLMRN